MTDKANSTTNKIFVGVAISVITAVIVAALGLGGGGGGGGTTTLNINGGNTAPVQSNSSATMCVTSGGSCPLAFSGQRGGSCYCQTVYGPAYGVAQ